MKDFRLNLDNTEVDDIYEMFDNSGDRTQYWYRTYYVVVLKEIYKTLLLSKVYNAYIILVSKCC